MRSVSTSCRSRVPRDQLAALRAKQGRDGHQPRVGCRARATSDRCTRGRARPSGRSRHRVERRPATARSCRASWTGAVGATRRSRPRRRTGEAGDPTRLISPCSTFQSCGSSSMLVRRRRRPMGVIRGSFGHLERGVALHLVVLAQVGPTGVRVAGHRPELDDLERATVEPRARLAEEDRPAVPRARSPGPRRGRPG